MMMMMKLVEIGGVCASLLSIGHGRERLVGLNVVALRDEISVC